VGEGLQWLERNRDQAAELGRRGRALAETVTWERVIERLLA